MFLPHCNVCSVVSMQASRVTADLGSFRWYKRAEAQKRYSFFFSSTTLAGGFGGLLASAIGKMDGLRGYHGWRWIFIIGMCFDIQPHACGASNSVVKRAS